MVEAYRIKNWQQRFETAETRKLQRLTWVPTPNRHDGKGFRRIASERDRCEIFAAWNLILQVSSKLPKHMRGWLVDEGVPLTADDLSFMTGFPLQIFEKAFKFLSDPKIGWLETAEYTANSADPAAMSGESPEIPAISPDTASESPATPADHPETTSANGREWNGKENKDSCNRSTSERRSQSPANNARIQLVDEAYITELKGIYKSQDVDRALAKFKAWLLTPAGHGKAFSKKRMQTFLRDAEPIGVKGVSIDSKGRSEACIDDVLEQRKREDDRLAALRAKETE